MKILYIHNAEFQDPNLEKLDTTLLQVVSMSQAFAKSKNKVFLALPKVKIAHQILQKMFADILRAKPAFKIYYYSSRFPFKLKKHFEVFSILSIINKIKPDIIYIRNPAFLYLLWLTKSSIIFESHNYLLHSRLKILECYYKKSEMML